MEIIFVIVLSAFLVCLIVNNNNEKKKIIDIFNKKLLEKDIEVKEIIDKYKHDIDIEKENEFEKKYKHYINNFDIENKYIANKNKKLNNELNDLIEKHKFNEMQERHKIYELDMKINEVEEKENNILKLEKNLQEKEKEIEDKDLRFRNLSEYYKKCKVEIEKREKDLNLQENELQERNAELFGQQLVLNKLIEERASALPWVAEQYALYNTSFFRDAEEYLFDKKHPSYTGAETVKICEERTKAALKEAFLYRGLVNYYESLFPNLSDFREDNEAQVIHEKLEIDVDPIENYKDDSAWDTLTEIEKFQRALDNYWRKRKSNWQIGRDYERFIGYGYEIQGYDVSFFGAIKGFEDMGRDLIVKKGNETSIIQCKYWSSEKVIHEKHIFQLYGTCVMYGIENKDTFFDKSNYLIDINKQKIPCGIFVTSCTLSNVARECADFLGIKVIENKKFERYPCIKCNVGNNGEKIYHLPFDQQYDKIKIEPEKGEFYCSTIQEAEEHGFRRAYRWHG